MKIVFLKDTGEPVHQVLALGRDHWEACQIGWSLIADGLVPGAADFQVEATNFDSTKFSSNDKDIRGSAASMAKLLTA